MPTLFSRIRSLVVAEAHHTVDGAEDPAVMAQQVLRDMTDEMQAARHGLVAALGAERTLERQRDQMLREAAEWERKAEGLLRRSQEPVAREALARAVSLKTGAAAQEGPLATARRTTERMRSQVDRLKSEFEHARNRVAVISANQAAAVAIGSVASASDAYTRAMDRVQELDRFERKAAQTDAQCEAAAELLDDHQSLERTVARADLDGAVDEALAAMKRRMAGAAETPGAQVTVETKFTVSEN